MSNFKQVVIYFLVSKLPVICHPLLSSYLTLSKNIDKNNALYDKFVVEATNISSTICLKRGEYWVRAVSGNLGDVHLSYWNVVYFLLFLGKKAQIHTNKLNLIRGVQLHCAFLRWEICV
jgi:hypothetical protein